MWIYRKLTRTFGKFPEKLKNEDLIYLENPTEVLAEVKKIVTLIWPDFDFILFQKVFDDTLDLFGGNYPGYRECNTLYHNLQHTIDCLLVMARLIYGASVSGIAFSEKDLNLGLISALMHDTGYIQAAEDNNGTGAKYTLTHIKRSMDFMRKYFSAQGFPPEDFQACCNFLRCTGIEVKIAEIGFQSPQHEILGKILGAADLIGQMSDKDYLGKLPLLYREFREGGVPGFANEFDLLQKTPSFWELVKERFAKELSRVDAYSAAYFRVRWGIEQDLYRKAIDNNIESLRGILRDCDAGYASCNSCKNSIMVYV